MNRVPKVWHEKDIYCSLIPNNDNDDPCYSILPRLGAFEVTTVIENCDIVLYSKLSSSLWPDLKAFTRKMTSMGEEMKQKATGAQLKAKF